jgi:hypothetical protein
MCWQAYLKAKLDTSLLYQDNKLLKVREGASADEIYITSKSMVLDLHPDRNQFSTWVQDNYSHLTDQQLDLTITQGKKVMLDYWHRWQQANENMIAQDQGICKQATILPRIAYMHTCIFGVVFVKCQFTV